jgi:2-amino-4-hydroxy-6-hydroxymethyldihydropteridine diphosphokinase
MAALCDEDGVLDVQMSLLHETEPVGGPDGQGLFLNAAARVETTLEPAELMARLLTIETGLGRERGPKWGPRVIDLDLLLYDDRIIDEPGLTVPHPRMHERRFVLAPLSEIARTVIHPRLNRTVGALLDDVNF